MFSKQILQGLRLQTDCETDQLEDPSYIAPLYIEETFLRFKEIFS